MSFTTKKSDIAGRNIRPYSDPEDEPPPPPVWVKLSELDYSEAGMFRMLAAREKPSPSGARKEKRPARVRRAR